MKIALTGGGTAGHIMPNLALLPELEKKFENIIYIGSTTGLEKDLVKNMPFYSIDCVKFQRKLTLKNLLIPFKLLKSVKAAEKILKNEKPDVLFSKGGFVALPVALACKKLKIPVVTHESDLSLGLANKIIARRAKYVCTAFSETADKLQNGVFCGMPLRENLKKGNRARGIKLCNLKGEKPVLLVIGGSLGAKNVNALVRKNLDRLLNNFEIIHLVGKNNLEIINKKNYSQIEFCSQMEDLYAASDLVVSRAGATVVCELMSLYKPSLLIPLSTANSRGDQLENANFFAKKNCCLVLEDETDNQKFIKSIELLQNQRLNLIENMKKILPLNANEKIVKILVQCTSSI